MEDVDASRVVPGAADAILRTLERLHLHWDGEVVWQSRRLPAYAAALAELASAGRVYACDCSRREVAGPYPGTCRGRSGVPEPHALRFALAADPAPLLFTDRWQGERRYSAAALGDPVVRRRDGLFAYQLAVVVDDAWQGVTDVVRGADLIDSTPWQLALQDALGLPRPGYAHVPLVTEPGGAKLAKSRRSLPVDAFDPGACLVVALHLLGQAPPRELERAGAREILAWARTHWRAEVLENRAEIAVDELGLGWEARL
jgi:glutamyl-Q tRNA(Asp) synthetase